MAPKILSRSSSSSLSSSCSDDDLKLTFEPNFSNFVPVPSKSEIDFAIASLQNFFLAVSSNREEVKRVVEMLESPTSRLLVSCGLQRLYASLHLWQKNSFVKRFMVSSVTDKAWWDAIMSNPLVRKIVKPLGLGQLQHEGIIEMLTRYSLQDRARNIQYIVGLNLQERTNALLLRPEKERSWSYLLLESLLKFTPLWTQITPEKEKEKRDKALMIDLNDDVLARKRAKMLEAAARKKRKGKSIEQDDLNPLSILPPIENTESQKVTRKKRKAPSEEQKVVNLNDCVSLNFPLEASFLSDPMSVLNEGRKILLPEDEKRLNALGHRKSSERTLVQSLLAIQGVVYIERELLALSEKNEELTSLNVELNKENERLKEELAQGVRQRKKDEIKLATLEKHNQDLEVELREALALSSSLKHQVADLEDA